MAGHIEIFIFLDKLLIPRTQIFYILRAESVLSRFFCHSHRVGLSDSFSVGKIICESFRESRRRMWGEWRPIMVCSVVARQQLICWQLTLPAAATAISSTFNWIENLRINGGYLAQYYENIHPRKFNPLRAFIPKSTMPQCAVGTVFHPRCYTILLLESPWSRWSPQPTHTIFWRVMSMLDGWPIWWPSWRWTRWSAWWPTWR